MGAVLDPFLSENEILTVWLYKRFEQIKD